MAKDTFTEYPQYSVWSMTHNAYDTHASQLIHLTGLEAWPEGHDIFSILDHAKQCQLVFASTLGREYVSKGKQQMDDNRDEPARFFIQTVRLNCKHPKAEISQKAQLLFSAFTKVDSNLTSFSYIEQSKSFQKLRKIFAKP